MSHRWRPGIRAHAPAAHGPTIASTPTSATGDQVSSLALGDVNGDRIADVAVAGYTGGNYVVTIYDGRGGGNSKDSVATPLITLKDPLGTGVGPLSVALGDFDGSGVSELAVAPAVAIPGTAPTVKIFSFQLQQQGGSPFDAPVVQAGTATTISPRGMEQAQGLQLAAADFGDGRDELVVGPAGSGAPLLDVYREQVSSGDWQLKNQINLGGGDMAGGVSLSAGALKADGAAQIVVGSQTDGRVEVLDANGSVQKSFRLLRNYSGGVRVAVVSSYEQAGAIIVAPETSPRWTVNPALVSASTWKARSLAPAGLLGSGPLVPLGGGFVYPRNSVNVNAKGTAGSSKGPDTPTVILAPTTGGNLIVEGFTLQGKPSSSAVLEPILSAATPGSSGWTPLEIPGDMPGVLVQSVPLVAYPKIAYQSPFRIDLSSAPQSIDQGLWPTTPVSGANNSGWGPQITANTPPTVPAGQGTEWLRERLLAAYAGAIGVASQHHHNPFWQPVQGQMWNVAAIGYQTQGVDCTNLTAYAYADALGITMDSTTAYQAEITPQNVGTKDPDGLVNITIPQAIQPRVKVEVLPGPAGDTLADYNNFVKELQP
jgi:hypothetical protein